MQPRLGAAMAVTCGIAVATIYFIQPLLGAVERAFPGSEWAALIPTLTQLGYAAGLIALVPLGDIVDRRNAHPGSSLPVWPSRCSAAAMAPSAVLLGAASFVIGVFAAVAQQVVPLAATLSDAGATRRGRRRGDDRLALRHPVQPHCGRPRDRPFGLARDLRLECAGRPHGGGVDSARAACPAAKLEASLPRPSRSR